VSWATKSWASRTREPEAIPAQPELQYRTGQRVRHSFYGEGMVLESELEGRQEMVTVLFGNGIGIKKLLSSMAPLEPLPDH